MLVSHPFAYGLSADKSNANFHYCLKMPVFSGLLLFIYFPRRFLFKNAMVRSHASFAAAAS
jgi:hypothetical protein